MLKLQPEQTQIALCILLVETDVVVRHPLAEYLRECGYRVVEAGDADEAIEIFRNEAPIDVVFIDVTGPGNLDAIGLARWIRDQHKGAKVVMASTLEKVTDQAGDLCGQEGAAISKPYDHQVLLERVKRELARSDRSA